jgi:hypothetical protein
MATSAVASVGARRSNLVAKLRVHRRNIIGNDEEAGLDIQLERFGEIRGSLQLIRARSETRDRTANACSTTQLINQLRLFLRMHPKAKTGCGAANQFRARVSIAPLKSLIDVDISPVRQRGYRKGVRRRAKQFLKPIFRSSADFLRLLHTREPQSSVDEFFLQGRSNNSFRDHYLVSAACDA